MQANFQRIFREFSTNMKKLGAIQIEDSTPAPSEPRAKKDKPRKKKKDEDEGDNNNNNNNEEGDTVPDKTPKEDPAALAPAAPTVPE